MKIIKKTAVILLVVLIGMQFYRPEKNTAQDDHTDIFITETNPPKDVKYVLKNTCYDCYSNDTKYPRYNIIAPVSYWLTNQINMVRENYTSRYGSDIHPKRKA